MTRPAASKLTEQERGVIIEALKRGQSVRGLATEKGIDAATVRYWGRKLGVLPPPTGERRSPSPSGNGNKARAIELAWQGYCPASVQKELNIALATARFYVQEWRRGLRASGVELPPCRCGAANDHIRACIEKSPKHLPSPLKPNGRVIASGDALLDRIELLVPRGYAADIRQDIVADLYLAVLEGTVLPDRLEIDGRKIVNATLVETGAARFNAETISFDDPSLNAPGRHRFEETISEGLWQ